MRHFRHSSLCIVHSALCIALAFAVANASAVLPAGYSQLSSITSTGTQYIKTGMLPTSATTVEMDFNTGPYANDTTFFGQNWTSSQYLFIKQSNAYKFYGGGGQVSPRHDNEDAHLSITDENKFILAYADTAVTTTVSRATSGGAFNIFADAGGNRKGSWTLYALKIWTGGVPMRDFVPALRAADNAVGLYDLVEGKFYENAGTGAFTKGAILADDTLAIASSAAESCSTPSPPYGTITGLKGGDTVPVFCGVTPWTNAVGTVNYSYAGWKLYDSLDIVRSQGTETSFTYTHPTPAAFRRLEWQWEGEYRAAALAAAGEGTATVSADWVADGGSVTFTATPAPGHAFSCWMDGSTAVSRDNPCTLTINAPKKLRAVFTDTSASGWRYDGSSSTKTLTELDPPDGGPAWVLTCTISGQNLTVSGVQTVGTNAVLNLRLPVADANDTPYAIVSIAANAFKSRNTIEEVLLPDTLTSIGQNAFETCLYLRRVRLSSCLATIGYNAFQGDSRLVEVEPFLPEGVTSVGSQAFYNCWRLTSPLAAGHAADALGNPVAVSLGEHAFRNTKIPSIDLGEGIQTLPGNGFSENAALLSVHLPETLTSIGGSAFNGCTSLAVVEPLLPASCTYLGASAFCNCNVLEGEVHFATNGAPASLGGSQIFYAARRITKVILGPGVTGTVPAHFCYGASVLADVVMPDTLTAIGDNAFNGCSSLTHLHLPTNLTSIGGSAFTSCSSLETVEPLLPAPCTYIGSMAFHACTKLTGDLFFATNNAAASFGGSHNFGGGDKVDGTRLTSVTLGEGVTAVSDNCFLKCRQIRTVRLPANLRTLGAGAFSGCSSLETVEPLLPATLTSLGGSAFASCSKLAGEVYIGTNGTAVALGGQQTFDYVRGVTKIVLGPGVTSIPPWFCRGATALAEMRMTDAVTKIGNNAFESCTALTVFEPLLPAACTTIDNSAFSGCTGLTDDVFFATNNAAASIGQYGFYGSRIPSITMGAGVTKLDTYSLGNNPALRRIVFANKPATINANALYNIANYQVSLVVPADDANWNAYVNSASTATPWASVSAVNQQKYLDAFPGEPLPRALSKSAPANQWIVSYGMTPAGEKDLVLYGLPAPYAAAAVSPAYGVYTNLAATQTLPFELTAPQYAREETTLYACAGYRIERAGALGWTDAADYALADATAPSASYQPDGDGERRLSWLWEPTGYQVVLALPGDASAGTVTVAGQDIEGYFTPGATATVTAVPGPGATFSRWYGDVPEGHETDATLTLAMDGPKHLTPEFAASWVLAADGKTITDGYWTLNVTGTRNALVVGKPVETPAHGILDLRKPIECGGAFISFASYAFQDSTALKELRLPDTITSIGYMSFKNCTTLTTVDPLLPASVTYLRDQAFYGCTSLTGDLFLGTNGVPVTFESGSHFRYTKVASATLGDGVTTIPGRFMQNCPSLGTVKMGEGVTSIGAYAFEGCSSLTTFEPLLPAALTKLYTQAFCNCPNLEGDLFIGTNGAPVSFPDGNNQFQFAAKITSATFGPGVSTIPGRFLESASSLRSVTFSEGLVEIGGYAFFTTPLTDIRLPETLTTIGAYAFKNCTSLTTVEPFLPASVTSLDTEAFCCTALTGDLFLGTNGAPVRFPTGGSQFRYTEIGSATLGGGVTEIPGRMFEDCASLKRAHVSDSLTTINGYAFNNCSSLTNFTPLLPASIATVNLYAFGNCSALDGTVEVGGHRKSVTFQTDGHQFDGAGVTEVIVGPGLATVPGATFKNCARLKTITLDSTTSLGNSVFGADTAVRDVYFIGDSVPTFGTAANNTSFQGWTAGQSRLHLPSGSAAWKAWADANTTPWNALTDDDRDSFRDRWPTGKKPYARTKAKVVPEYQWVLGWTPSCGTVILLR